MDRERAEIHIKKCKDNAKKIFSIKSELSWLLLNTICIGISIALIREFVFIIVISTILVFDVILTVALTLKNKNYINFIIIFGLQVLTFCCVLNCIAFGLYKVFDKFVLWEFLVSLLVQLLSFIVWFIFVRRQVELCKETENHKSNMAGTAAGFFYALGLILFRIFNPAMEVVLLILVVLLNLMVCLLNYVIAGYIYNLYLISKYKLSLYCQYGENNED